MSPLYVEVKLNFHIALTDFCSQNIIKFKLTNFHLLDEPKYILSNIMLRGQMKEMFLEAKLQISINICAYLIKH
jgi:hypothetical protein